MLTGKQIAEMGIITGFDVENIQQQGIDLRLRRIRRVWNQETMGVVGKDKTVIPKVRDWEWIAMIPGQKILLEPGYYEVEFVEGCDIKSNVCMRPLTRSSVIRCGGEIRSGLFDAGFHTGHIGSYLKVDLPFYIEEGCRLSQAVCFQSSEVENLYNGQFQNDNQRE